MEVPVNGGKLPDEREDKYSQSVRKMGWNEPNNWGGIPNRRKIGNEGDIPWSPDVVRTIEFSLFPPESAEFGGQTRPSYEADRVLWAKTTGRKPLIDKAQRNPVSISVTR